MGKIYSNSKAKSFGGYSFYNSNQVLNDYLRKKRNRKNLEKAGFKIWNTTLKAAMTREKVINKNKEKWVFQPNHKNYNFNLCGARNNGLVFSTFGRLEKKYKLNDGQLHVYNKEMKSSGQYFQIYVFVNSNRDIVKTVWYLL